MTISAPAKILLLCSNERKKAYQPIVERWAGVIELVDNPGDVLALSFRQPPAGILIDLLDSSYLGRERLAALLDLRVVWPIMRCNTDGQGEGLALWPARERRCPIHEAIAGMLKPDASWGHPVHVRQYIRLEYMARVRILRADTSEWRLSNILNMGIGGVYAISYDTDWTVGQNVSVELHDLTVQPLTIQGTVAWLRPWEAGNDRMPGIGIKIMEEAGTNRLADVICRGEIIERLWAHFK